MVLGKTEILDEDISRVQAGPHENRVMFGWIGNCWLVAFPVCDLHNTVFFSFLESTSKSLLVVKGRVHAIPS